MAGRATIATALAAALACLCVPAAVAAETVPTAISSFSWTDADGDTDYFDGAIDAEKRKCVRRRTVHLYRGGPGNDQRVATTRTKRDGSFVIRKEDPGSGGYYVRVTREFPGSDTCKPAKTSVLSVTDLEGV